MSEDLTSAAQDALNRMLQLQQRSQDVQATLAKVRASATEQTNSVESAQSGLQPKLESVARHLDQLEARLSQAAQAAETRLEAVSTGVQQQGDDGCAQQKAARERLAALRAGYDSLSLQLEALQHKAVGELQAARENASKMLASTLAVLQDTESSLHHIRPHVRDARTRIEQRSRKFREKLEDQVLPGIQQGSQNFERRLQTLADRLQSALQKAAETGRENCLERGRQFVEKGGSRDVQAAAKERSAQTGQLCEELGRKAKDLANSCGDHAQKLQQDVSQAQEKFETIHSIAQAVEGLFQGAGL